MLSKQPEPDSRRVNLQMHFILSFSSFALYLKSTVFSKLLRTVLNLFLKFQNSGKFPCAKTLFRLRITVLNIVLSTIDKMTKFSQYMLV